MESQLFGLVLGRVVERLRLKRLQTQAQLAATLGVSQPVISRIEAGKIQPDSFLYGRLAAAFDMPVEVLHEKVNRAIAGTKAAAAAVSQDKPWEEVVKGVGLIGLVGLIAFAVAALVDDGSSPFFNTSGSLTTPAS